MYEEFLEDIAQTNGLRGVNTYLKLIAGIGAILLCLLSTSYIPPLFIASVLSMAILYLARIELRTYGELFIVPFSFAVMSVVVIVLLSGGGEVYWSWNPLPWFSLSITSESINEGFFVFCRVIGGMSGLIFIAVTTPMTDLFVVMKQFRIPEVVLDLAMIIYRSIFMIMEQLKQTYQAQVMRLGYGSFRESIQSFATMCGSVFIASWESGEDLIRAMDARCYSGKFAILGETRPVEFLPVLAVAVFLILSSLVVVISRNITLIGAGP
ncbi:MAG: cobalt ECF transporter T component CbiQ [Methanoregulaceae archaeon]|nr:cobalt ECF transporter T component CbiQ [Methanoregulaceae archaeon]MCU0629225.1 cobalt ECF transporter T component CbiQ [Methanoregulaceae archaeon]